MDIRELLAAGQEQDADLGTSLSGKLPSGELIFSRPFGQSTKWRTANGGSFTVSMIFDPSLPWGVSNAMSSTTPDLASSLRKALGQQLVPEKMVDEKPNLEELIIFKMKELLPPEAFLKLCEGLPSHDKDSITLKGDFFVRYIKMLEMNIKASFEEDCSLLEAINNKEFDFTFQLAIDSYPNTPSSTTSTSSIDKTKASSNSGTTASTTTTPPTLMRESSGGGIVGASKRRGVLIIHLTGRPKERCDQQEMLIQVTSQHSRNKKEQQALDEVLDALQLQDAKVSEYKTTHFVKDVPTSSSALFQEIAGYLNAVLDQESQASIERAEKGHKNMYQ